MPAFDISTVIVPVNKAKATIEAKKVERTRTTKYIAFWSVVTAMLAEKKSEIVILDLLKLKGMDEKTGEMVPLCNPTEKTSASKIASQNFNKAVVEYRKSNAGAKLYLDVRPAVDDTFEKDADGNIAVLYWNVVPGEAVPTA